MLFMETYTVDLNAPVGVKKKKVTCSWLAFFTLSYNADISDSVKLS